MSYSGVDNTEQQGRPVELFEFILGTETFRYTSAEDTISALSVSFSPAAIKRGEMEASPEQGSQTLNIQLPADTDFVARYKSSLPSSVARVRAYKMHRGDTDIVLFFDGELQSVDFSEDLLKAEITALRDAQRISTPLLRYDYGAPCNNQLGDDICGVILATPVFTLDSFITVDNGTTLDVGSADSYADDWFTAGEILVVATGERRMVIDHTGSTVRIIAPFASNRQGLACQLIAGCDRNPHTCVSKFNNYPNFFGNAFSPTKNPYQSGVS